MGENVNEYFPCHAGLEKLKDDQENPGGSEVGTTNPQEEKEEKNDAVILLSAP
jgi:hypothetical protein